MKKTKKITPSKGQKIQSFLPVFNGFYSTIWEYKLEVDDELDHYNDNEERHPLLPPLTYDDLEIDYTKAHKDLAKEIFSAICEELISMKLIKDGDFEALSSPKEYNFYNDSINCVFILNTVNVRNINKYLKENFEAFKVHIKDHYTSCSGFSSFYSGHAETWLTESGDPLKHEHKLSAILNFILLNEGFDNEYFFDKVEFYMSEYITINEPEVSEELQKAIDLHSTDKNQLSMEL